jgi:ubiquinone/menaquinone biosynthesis C-methylase UbiE
VRGLEQIPALYDAMCWALEATGLRRWREWLARGATGLTLDIGCGTGRNLPLYKEQRVIGLDPSIDALRAARKRSPRTPLVRASAEALPFRDATFDTVVSGLVFCSVPDAKKGLSEVKRALKSQGTVRMLEHVRSTSEIGGKIQDFLQPAWTRLAGGCHNNRDTEATVNNAGFDIHDQRAKGTMRRFVAKPR